MTAYEYVKVLSVDIGPRPAGSDNNRRTAEFLRNELEIIGVDEVGTQEFALRPDFWNGTALLAITFTLAILFMLTFYPLFALILSVALPVLTVLEVDSGKEITMRFLPSKTGRNIIGKEKPSGESTKRIILCAHHDSKTQAIPIGVRSYIILLVLVSMLYLFVISLMTVLSVTVLPQAMEITNLVGRGMLLVVPFFFIYAILNYIARFVAQSPGADDDASAVSVILEVAKKLKEEPLSETEVWFLFTDGEEIAMKGAIEFVKTHHEILAESTVINIEGCGVEAPLAYSTKEMSLRTAETSERVIALFQRAARVAGEEAFPISRATTTDGYQFAKHGYDVSTIWRFSDEVREVAHTSKDNMNRIDSAALDNTVRFIDACLREFDGN